METDLGVVDHDGHHEPAKGSPRGGRRCRSDHAVELPAPDQPRQAGPGPRGRLRRGAQGRTRHALVRLRGRPDHRRTDRHPARRAQRRHSADHQVGAQLTTDPRVDMVSFTGSTTTGRSIMAAAAPTLKRVFLELGGKCRHRARRRRPRRAPVRLPAASHAGQGCAITTRIVVPRRGLTRRSRSWQRRWRPSVPGIRPTRAPCAGR